MRLRFDGVRFAAFLGFLFALQASPAAAQIRVGVDLSTTGPAASIGAPSRNVVSMWPTEIAGQKIEYVVLDDGSTPTGAVHQRAQADVRGQGRRDRRPEHDGERAGDARRARRDLDADDRARGVGVDRRADGREAPLGVQDAAERLADGDRRHEVDGRQRRQDARLHRLQRRVRRELAERAEQAARPARHPARRRRALQPRRHVGHGPGAQADGREPRRDPDRRRRHAGRHAADRARAARLQGSHLPDARHRDVRIPEGRRQGRRRHAVPDRTRRSSRRSCRTTWRRRRSRWTSRSATRRSTDRTR